MSNDETERGFPLQQPVRHPMSLSEEQTEELRELALPLMKWLESNFHPHVKIIVDSERAEMMEGLAVAVHYLRE